MPISLPAAAVPAILPVNVRFQIVSSCARPAGDGWLHEMKGGRMLLAAALVLPCTAIAQAADHRTTELTRACERWDKLLLSICKSGPR